MTHFFSRITTPLTLFLICSAPILGTGGCAKPADASIDDSRNTSATQSPHPADGSSQSPDAAIVKVTPVTLTTINETALAHGVTTAENSVVYAAEIPGRVGFMGFDVGDTVKKGDTLARIDFQTLKAQTQQAKTAHELATATYDRVATLKADGLVPSQQYDEVRANLSNSEANLAIAQANFRKAMVKANHWGIVAQKFVEQAEFVNPGSPLYQIIDYRNIIVEAQLAETQVAEIHPGNEVQVTIDALKQEVTGIVDTIVPTADPVSMTFTARVKIPNPDQRILVGMSARLIIFSKTHPDAVVVPQHTILEGITGEKTAFVVEDNLARQRKIELGPTSGSSVVVTKGLTPKDRLVVMGHRDLTDGQMVSVIE